MTELEVTVENLYRAFKSANYSSSIVGWLAVMAMPLSDENQILYLSKATELAKESKDERKAQEELSVYRRQLMGRQPQE